MFAYSREYLQRAGTPRVVDLSEAVHVGQGGDRPFEAARGRLADGTLKYDVTCTHSHVGTHVETPLHYFERGKAVGAYPIDHFVGRALLVRLARDQFPETTPPYRVTPAWLEARLGPRFQAGDVVLFHAPEDLRGDVRDHTGGAHESATLTLAAARYLVDREIKMLGFDRLSFGAQGRAIHDALLARDVLLIEFLAHLDALQTDEFLFCAAPVRVVDLDSGWARAWALEVVPDASS